VYTFRIAYFNCFSGISGDMCLGALIDAGVPLKGLEKELGKIPVTGYKLSAKKVKRGGLSATKVDFETSQGSGVRSQKVGMKRWKDIEKIIDASSLSPDIRRKGTKIFKEILRAEAKVHGKAFDNVHLHELGGTDCLIDVFGTIIGLDMLGVEKVYSSPVNLGGGSIKTTHGVFPVPAPATAEILRGVPVYSTDFELNPGSSELTTPTGAALLKGLASGFGGIPSVNIEKTGFGAGSRNLKDRPNVLGLIIGEQLSSQHEKVNETAVVIEVNIDDMNPQVYEHVMEKLLKAGALDVYLTQVIMKKGRPGVKLTVLCLEAQRERLIEIIMKETTTIGLRFYKVKRKVLGREIKVIDTEFGKVRVKVSRFGNGTLKTTPEYEDCRRIAKKLNMPLIEVMRRIKIPPSRGKKVL
jgi:uncharacterized protein (TIGR00299 family) protein